MTLRPGPGRTQRQLAGDAGEEAALAHLQRHGLVLIERNFHCRGGELDLIMRDGATLVFVEVRRRASGGHGGAAGSIGWTKQRRIVFAARHFLLRLGAPPPCRFDVVTVEQDR
ncbi:MAG TPA: YraN family protein, partial [Noviherbaspirillum sp.]